MLLSLLVCWPQALEKYLMTKLHERTFRRGADDVERDEALAVRCVALGFVRPEHLEIPPGVVDDTHLGRAVEELNKINKYKVGCWLGVAPEGGWLDGWRAYLTQLWLRAM